MTLRTGCVVLCLLLGGGCQQKMAHQPKYWPLDPSPFFGDGRSARPLVAGTVPRGHAHLDTHLYAGQSAGKVVETFPFPITFEVLQRGQQRFNIFCAPCHAMTGTGDGMIVSRGFTHPPSFYNEPLRQAPVGHYFDVITNGFGAMGDYAAQVPPHDRWAIIAYIRALQQSRPAQLASAPRAEADLLAKGNPGR